MEIIGAGFGRTGTLSLKAALEQLGYGRCYHMAELMDHPEHATLWIAAARGELRNWDELLSDYRATVDWPGCRFWRELMDAYPHAKVILTVRDAERWYESASNTIFRQATGSWRERLPMLASLAVRPDRLRFLRVIHAVIAKGTFGGRMKDKQHLIDVFNRHNEEVKRTVPTDRLLVYELKQGWKPLCDFLGVDVPDTAFPHLNDSAAFHTTFGARLKGGAVGSVVPAVAALGAAGVLGVLAARRRRRSC